MKYVVGIDGGGTKTIGYIGNSHGEIIGTAVVGPTNYHSVGLVETKKNLKLIIKDLLSISDLNIDEVNVISLGLAGVGREEDKKTLEQTLRDLNIGTKIILNSDAVTALVGAHGKSKGIITISGTGSISLGVDEEGNMARAGGWGHIIDDEGSGYDIGRMVLNSVVQAFDGRGEKTVLTNALLDNLNIKSIDSLVKYVYKDMNNKDNIARLAPLALRGALKGDKVSIHILKKATDSLVFMTEAVIRKLKNNVKELCLMGGVFDNFNYLTEQVAKNIRQRNPKIIIKDQLFNGGVGALILAWIELGLTYDTSKLKLQMKEVNYCE